MMPRFLLSSEMRGVSMSFMHQNLCCHSLRHSPPTASSSSSSSSWVLQSTGLCSLIRKVYLLFVVDCVGLSETETRLWLKTLTRTTVKYLHTKFGVRIHLNGSVDRQQAKYHLFLTRPDRVISATLKRVENTTLHSSPDKRWEPGNPEKCSLQ